MNPSEIELAAVLNLVPYLDIDFNYSQEVSLNTLIADYSDKLGDDETFKILKDAVAKNPEYGQMILVDQSSTNSTSNWKDDLIQGCTFKDKDGNYYVSYRGTGDKRWLDNGDGITAPSTEMQEAAKQYFDEMAEKYFVNAHENGNQIIVTGHSKGGNEAQFVYMSAEYEYLIDKCYSFDGQGFSGKARENFKKRYGSNYSKKVSNMYSICGKEDYVNGLGYIIIPDENIYFVDTSGEGFESYHALENMIGENGEYKPLSWSKKNGEIVNGEQGEIGRFARKLSERMMKIDDENLHGIALAIMSIMDSDSLTDLKADITDYIDLIAHGVPVAFETLLFTEEGGELVKKFVGDWFYDLYEKHGIVGVVGGFLVLSTAVVILTPVIVNVVVIAKIIDIGIELVGKFIEFTEDVKEFFSEIKEFVVSTVKKIIDKIKSFSAGYKYANSNPKFSVDTYKLKNYAQSLTLVNGRIVKLDKRLDKLYSKVGLLDLWNLMKADILVGYSVKLTKCASYLKDTASDFEKAEKEIKNSI